jgi:hypothetical protein
LKYWARLNPLTEGMMDKLTAKREVYLEEVATILKLYHRMDQINFQNYELLQFFEFLPLPHILCFRTQVLILCMTY